MSGETAIYLGIDLGHHSIVTASSSAEEPFQVTVDANGLSNRSTPSIIGIENKRVIFGEEAENRLLSVPQKIVSSIPPALEHDAENAIVIDTGGADGHIAIQSAHLFSLFFRNYIEQVHAGKSIKSATIAVPVSFSAKATQVLVDSAHLAGIVNFQVIDHMDAAMTVLCKDPAVASIASLVVVDCGFSQTAVGLMSNGTCTFKQAIPAGVGALIELIADTLIVGEANFLGNIQTCDKKFYFRFFKVCEKALKDLSMLPSTVVDVSDFEEAFERCALLSKERIKSLCKAPIHISRESFEKQLETNSTFFAPFLFLLKSVASSTPVDRVEVVGGGSRVPVIAKTIAHAFACDSVGRGLDGSSFSAVGAALWAAGKREWEANRVAPADESRDLEEARLVQKQIEDLHAIEVEKLRNKNLLEAYLYQVKHWTEEGLCKEKIDPVLETVWDWFYSAEDAVTGAQYLEKLGEVKELVESEGKAFFDKRETERKKTEASLTANAEYLSSSSAHESASEKRSKHSSALSVEQSLKLAMKNKDEGNDLFKHGTVTDAMSRYMRAINIIAKIPSPISDEIEKKTADSILLAANLNMAQCVVRITVPSNPLSQEERDGLLKRGLACADSALAIDPVNPKAKYRKAVCLDRLRETEQAKKVIDEALKESPNDLDLKQLYDSLVATLKQQQTKAKKFFSKMFQ